MSGVPRVPVWSKSWAAMIARLAAAGAAAGFVKGATRRAPRGRCSCASQLPVARLPARCPALWVRTQGTKPSPVSHLVAPPFVVDADAFEPALSRSARTPGLLDGKLDRALAELRECRACPRNCGVDRVSNADGRGAVCMVGRRAVVSTAAPHFGEESCLQGWHGSGTIFFGGCNMRCVFCQNHDISQRRGQGYDLDAPQLAEWMLKLQDEGCHNINLVTPEHVVPQVVEALVEAHRMGLRVPVVYNSSAYDSVESLRLMEGLVDIYMPDFKFWEPATARRLAHAEDYPTVARSAISEMHRQVGHLKFTPNGLALSGLLVRHLVMPDLEQESRKIMQWIARELGKDTYVHVMEQYRPDFLVGKEWRRRRASAHTTSGVVDTPAGAGVRHAGINRPASETELNMVEAFARLAGLWRMDTDWDSRFPFPLASQLDEPKAPPLLRSTPPAAGVGSPVVLGMGTTTHHAGADIGRIPAGSWRGDIAAGGMSIRAALRVKQEEGQATDDGTAYPALFDSPDQGVTGMSATYVVKNDGSVEITVKLDDTNSFVLRGSLVTGTRSTNDRAEEPRLHLTMYQGTRELPVTLSRVPDGPPADGGGAPLTEDDGSEWYRRPQTPKEPFPYEVRDVTFENPEADGITIGGTITMPPGDTGTGVGVGVVLVHGSGSHGRDSVLLGHRTFHVLADHLSRNGVAVLRYDKRGNGETTGDANKASGLDFMSDARAAFDHLRKALSDAGHTDVRVGFIGHSEGASVSTSLAADAASASQADGSGGASQDTAALPAFVVQLGGMATRGVDVLREQGAVMVREGASEAGWTPADVEAMILIRNRVYDACMQPGATSAAVCDVATRELNALDDEQRARVMVHGDLTAEQIAAHEAAWVDAWRIVLDNDALRWILQFDPTAVWPRMRSPVLCVYGELDMQVALANADAAEALLAGHDNPMTRRLSQVVRVPRLNHIMQTATTGMPDEYAKIEETFAPVVLDTVTDWILHVTSGAE